MMVQIAPERYPHNISYARNQNMTNLQIYCIIILLVLDKLTACCLVCSTQFEEV